MPHPRRRAPENDVSYVDPGGGADAGDSAIVRSDGDLETVRSLTGSTYAIVGLVSRDLDRIELMMTSGYDEATTRYLRSRSAVPSHITRVLQDRRPIRGRNPDGNPETIDLPLGESEAVAERTTSVTHGTGSILLVEDERAVRVLVRSILTRAGYAKDTLLDTRRLAENAGFIAKPFTAESLTRKVGELLGR